MNRDDHKQRYIELEGTLNMRDLGGYPTADGRVTRYGQIIRSDNLDKLSPESQARLINHPVGTVIDIRSPWENEKYPNVFTHSDQIVYRNLPFWDEEVIETKENVQDRQHYYRLALEMVQPEIGAIMAGIAEADPSRAVLFHCAAGKDRTGLIAAMLLALVKVAPNVIAEDYALSGQYLAPRIDEWRRQAIEAGMDMERFEYSVATHAQVMLDTLEHLEKTYRGVKNYLLKIGLNETQLDGLHARLLDGQPDQG